MALVKYGLDFPDNASPADIELVCFNRSWSPEQGGLGRFEHLRNAIDLIWNEPRRRYAFERKIPYDPDKSDAFIWNEWTELMMRAFCDEREVIIAGSGASWKTTCMAMFFLCYWLCSPYNTRVILTSTTGDGLRARVWKELSHFYRPIAAYGNLVQSRTMIQTVKGDDGAGIFGIAVEADGNVDKAVGKIIGRHNTRMGIGVSEMPTVNAAIIDAGNNLETGAEDFRFIGDGNPASRLDQHGQACEPEAGWNSITDETETWRTKRGGLAIHLDGRRSPKNRHPDKFPGLIGPDDIERTATRDGENSLKMWQQRIGFWAPEGSTQTVLSETMILRFRARERAIWAEGYKTAAGLDPSFEGDDRKVLRFVKFGMGIEGKFLISFYKTVVLKVDITDPTEPTNYQTVRLTRRACEEEDVPPSLFGLDSTGAGGPLADIFAREWSPEIIRVNFGGRASDRPVSETNPRKCWEEYGNKVTQLWYGFQVLVRNDHIRDLDDETAREFCSRYYELRGNVLWVEPKKVMKLRFGRSPDLADGAVVATYVVQSVEPELGGTDGIIGKEAQDRWRDIAKQYDVSTDYSQREEEFAEFGS